MFALGDIYVRNIFLIIFLIYNIENRILHVCVLY